MRMFTQRLSMLTWTERLPSGETRARKEVFICDATNAFEGLVANPNASDIRFSRDGEETRYAKCTVAARESA